MDEPSLHKGHASYIGNLVRVSMNDDLGTMATNAASLTSNQ